MKRPEPRDGGESAAGARILYFSKLLHSTLSISAVQRWTKRSFELVRFPDPMSLQVSLQAMEIYNGHEVNKVSDILVLRRSTIVWANVCSFW